jgi:hypothetical protein
MKPKLEAFVALRELKLLSDSLAISYKRRMALKAAIVLIERHPKKFLSAWVKVNKNVGN